MTQDMNCSKTVARQKEGSRKTLAILFEYAWSMPRVCLEYAKSMARVWLEYASPLLRCVAVLILMVVGVKVWGQTQITSLSGITDVNGSYILSSSFSTTGTARVGGTESGAEIGTSTNPFKGTIDGQLVTITGTWNKPLFDYVEDATIKNVIIGSASINITTANTNVGAIAANAQGETRIYNCGILDGSVSGTKYVGGLVGHLYDKETNKGSRVINCFSYANVSGGTEVAGIVGYNNYASTSGDIRTMVMNCMFYGDVSGNSKVSPVYGGKNINNLNNGKTDGTSGLNTFNYYSYEKAITFRGYPENTNSVKNKNYNCALAVEEKYLNRFEFYRLLLNSNKTLAAIYATKTTLTVNSSDMAKWVLETADRTVSSPKPYPILKAQGYYPSIINIDADHAPSLTLENDKPKEADRKKGGKLGKTLTVHIGGVGNNAPSGASIIRRGAILLPRTDKDEDRFNFNYDKVQLPYYNDVGKGNYTGNRVVTGWKIISITSVANDPYTISNYDYSKTYSSDLTYFDYPNYNFADRKSSNKDLYSISGRVFSQGAYFDVPYGVTSITIEPYWGIAAYIADEYRDVVYKSGYGDAQNVTQLGNNFGSNGTEVSINGSSQKVYTKLKDNDGALASLTGVTNPTVYDYAVVLVGNYHQSGVPSDGTKPFTMMSIDLDQDNEPDYSCIFHHTSRAKISPIRFDFLNIIGTAQAQKPNGATKICNSAVFKTLGWFEVTNTALMYFSQFEYENKDGVTKSNSPIILLGGVFDQFVSTQNKAIDGKTIYVHVGSNVWMKSLALGTHGDGSYSTPHVPISVTGGDVEGLYLTGTYNQNAGSATGTGGGIKDDNAECYISGGRFQEVAGAGQEQLGNSTTKGNVHWQIYDADIKEFYGGGINDAKPIKGSITTDIFNSHITQFCGGPKFGNMATDKKITTTAEGCTFGKYFGAGYGGTSYNRQKYYDYTGYSFSDFEGYYTTDKGKYFDAKTDELRSYDNAQSYGYKGPGVATDFDYEFFVWNSGSVGARCYVKFASFSLAQCNEVESNLTNCTINENFYGGGKLGKVVGIVSSVLDGCKVKGNVFGAGFSGTPEPVPVRSSGFTKYPKFNASSGIFEPGVFSETTPYTWKKVENYPENGGDGFDGTQLITTIDLRNSNLGSVSNDVNLTIKGESVIGTDGDANTGNVYGGGDASYVTGSDHKITVKLAGKTLVTGNVYGGGNEGLVEGSTEVNILENVPTSNNNSSSNP